MSTMVDPECKLDGSTAELHQVTYFVQKALCMISKSASGVDSRSL